LFTCASDFIQYHFLYYCGRDIDIRLRPSIATPPKEDQATATGDLHNKFREDRSSGSEDMLADRQTDTQTDRQTDHNTRLSYRARVTTFANKVNSCSILYVQLTLHIHLGTLVVTFHMLWRLTNCRIIIIITFKARPTCTAK